MKTTIRTTTFFRLLPILMSVAVLTGRTSLRAQETKPAQSKPSGLEPAPILVSLTAMPGYGRVPLTVGFFPDVADPAEAGIAMYRWNFGDGHVSISPPMFTYNVYTQPGNYVVSLTVTTVDGRSATGFAGVTVTGPAPP